jgi:hypothetical protein
LVALASHLATCPPRGADALAPPAPASRIATAETVVVIRERRIIIPMCVYVENEA